MVFAEDSVKHKRTVSKMEGGKSKYGHPSSLIMPILSCLPRGLVRCYVRCPFDCMA